MNKINNFYNWMESVNNNFLDPTEFNEGSRYCELCDIEENKTYFVEDTNICEDCFQDTKDEPYLTTETKAD